jgi:hypothetical protein
MVLKLIKAFDMVDARGADTWRMLVILMGDDIIYPGPHAEGPAVRAVSKHEH